MSNLVNATPQSLNVFDATGENQLLVIPPSGIVPRVKTQTVQVGEAQGIPLFTVQYGEVQDLPEPEEGTIYIVSLLVKQAMPGRTDLASPGELIRDAEGKPKGCKGLSVS